VATPAEIDITTAEELRAVLLEATKDSHPRLVVDMTRTRFCDSAGLQALIGAHNRVLAKAASCGWSSALTGPFPAS
jgi:anti-sigma B factor antagonist